MKIKLLSSSVFILAASFSMMSTSAYSYWSENFWIPEEDYYAPEYFVSAPIAIIPSAPPSYEIYPEYYPYYYNNPYPYPYSSGLVTGFLAGAVTAAAWDSWNNGWSGGYWNHNWNNNKNNTYNYNNAINNTLNINTIQSKAAAQDRHNAFETFHKNQQAQTARENLEKHKNSGRENARHNLDRNQHSDDHMVNRPVENRLVDHSVAHQDVRLQGYSPREFQERDFGDVDHFGGLNRGFGGGFHSGGGLHGGGRR